MPEEKDTLIFDIMSTLDPEELELGSIINLAEMTSYDQTQIFRPTENAPCEGVKDKLNKTIRAGSKIIIE